MSRPLRIEFPGAVYHLTSRGDRREAIYADDRDRAAQLHIVSKALERFDAQMLAYCLMGNHYHFVLHTRAANLSRLMRHINGVYTQHVNRRHGLVGHLFQGRYKAILVDRDAYLMQVCRYVELNPVRAGLVAAPGDWLWSSCRAHVGLADAPRWLDVAALQAHLLGRPAADAADRRRAATRYADLLASGTGQALWADHLRHQIYLGDAHFIERTQQQCAPTPHAARPSREVPRLQRAAPRTLQDCLNHCGPRDEALRVAYTQCGITMTEMAAQLELSVSRISRLIATAERRLQAGSRPRGSGGAA